MKSVYFHANKGSIFLLLLSLFTAPVHAKAQAIVQEIDHIVAVVDDDVITASELSRQTLLVTQRISQRGAKLPPEEILQKQIIEQMILEKLQLQIAHRAGIRVDDETINKVIGNIAQENRLSMDQFRQVLAQDGFSFSEFREKIKNEITINRVRQKQVQSRVSVSESEVDNFLASMANREGSDDELNLAHILIALPEAASPAQIQAAREKGSEILNRLMLGADFAQTAISYSQGQKALEGGELGWRKATELPPLFALAVANMQPGDISDLIRSPSGFHILRLIERRNRESRKIIEQTLARHILIRPDEVLNDSQALDRLQKLRERILAGADFGQLARANSDDPGSAANGGSLGWSNPGKMVPEFEDQMNRLKPGEISEPFRTQYGWHIVQVMSRREHDNTLDDQRLKARREIGKRKSEEAVETWMRQIRGEAYVEIRLNQ